jgi:hypothetical protein
MANTNTKESPSAVVRIKAPNMQRVKLEIEGITHLMLNRFSSKAQQQIKATQEAGSVSRGKRTRAPKDFEALYHEARHISEDGWDGFAASAIRNGSISACRTVDFKMTHAKLAIFVEADGYDRADGTPLVKLTKGKPSMDIGPARNDNGSIDLRARPKWEPGWRAVLTIRYDADMFGREDIVNLISRLGLQVGIGEGRPDSRNSAGTGNGMFQVLGGAAVGKAA